MGLRFGRLAALVLALGVVGSSASGCLTVATWRWAMTPRVDGEMLGVYRNTEGDDVVVYRLGPDTGYDPGYYAFWVPQTWGDGEPSGFGASGGGKIWQFPGDSLTLEGLESASVPAKTELAPIQVFASREAMLKRPLSGEPRKAFTRYRLVRQVDPDGIITHELYAWSIAYDGWALLGSGRLGQGHTRAWVAGVLTPFTLIADVFVTLIFGLFILAGSAH